MPNGYPKPNPSPHNEFVKKKTPFPLPSHSTMKKMFPEKNVPISPLLLPHFE